jgi:hypothetical protein
MGWEIRHGNKQYYYQKERRGNKIISRYIGGGHDGELMALLISIIEERSLENKSKREEHRKLLAKINQQLTQMDAILDIQVDIVSTILKAKLLACGYHHYKGEWRKRRIKLNDE